ncbi:MAG: helix-turn-helix transcriptional regulator [Faecousia sp.]
MEQTMGARIAAYRKREKMTQEELGEKLGVSAQAVSKWENDASVPDVSLLLPLADHLRISVENLLGRESASVMLAETVPLERLTFRILVDSAQGDRVRVNLPMKLVNLLAESGLLDTRIVKGSSAVENLDISGVLELVSRGVIGELVTVDSADGDHVRIVVEE